MTEGFFYQQTQHNQIIRNHDNLSILFVFHHRYTIHISRFILPIFFIHTGLQYRRRLVRNEQKIALCN